jgi:protein ImuA
MTRAARERETENLRADSGALSRAGSGRAGRLAALKAKIAALEADGNGFVQSGRARLEPGRPVPAPAANDADPLAGFRAQAGLHDLRPHTYLDAPAAYAFAVRWLAGLPGDRLLVWVRAPGESRLDFGAPSPDGLRQAGINPARLMRVDARPGADALWAMEEALKAGALVFGEAGAAKGYDLTASRRLHAAAKAKGGQILVARAHDADAASAALTRWRIAASPGAPAPWRGAGGLQGLGSQKLIAVLERRRGGAPDRFELEWEDDALRRLEPAALAHRAPQAATG